MDDLDLDDELDNDLDEALPTDDESPSDSNSAVACSSDKFWVSGPLEFVLKHVSSVDRTDDGRSYPFSGYEGHEKDMTKEQRELAKIIKCYGNKSSASQQVEGWISGNSGMEVLLLVCPPN